MTQPYDLPTVTELARGIDVSYWQVPKSVNWRKLAETHTFVYVRATYGTKVDPACAEHLTRAREAGLLPGLYHFFRPSLSAAEQLEAFGDVAEAVGMAPGWLAPALDIEQDKHDGAVTQARYAHAEDVVRAWIAQWKRAVIYTNPATWLALGSPDYIRDCDLWISHYGVRMPKTPLGLPWALWQHLVAPLPAVYPYDLDQNMARVLPIVPVPRAAAEPVLEQDLAERRQDRDTAIKDERF